MPFNIDNQYQQNWFKPAIYAQIYFDRIFAAAGYSYTWDGLADANFDKLLIPYNGDQNVVDWQDVYVEAENSGVTLTGTNPGGVQDFLIGSITTGWTEISDPANIFNTTNGQYSTPQWIGAGSGESYVYQATVSGSVQIENVSADDLYTAPVLGVYGFVYVPFLVVKVGFTQNTKVYSSQSLEINYTQASPFPANSLSSTYSFTEVFTLSATTNTLGTGGIDVGDIQIVRAGVALGYLNSAGQRVILGESNGITWLNTSFNEPADNSPDIILDLTSIDLTIRPSDNIPLNSGITTMNTFIPDKIKQSDFIKSIFLMYNLYVTEDPNSEN
jgi:hypothetical protein